ncbi:MAG: class II aldolase/adducin family protein [Candidatus Zixiibacteriota bacterium]|nr:MAG: class II aldolase/adducin family protein [candidate division Zixibacteria bacterium]
MSDILHRQTLSAIGRRLYRKGFVAGTDGNLSCRLDSDKILITASGTALGFLAEGDFVVLNPAGEILTGRKAPSSEYLMHLAVYRARHDVMACCHAHPPFATARATAGKGLPSGILPEIVAFVGDIPLADYAPPGTEAVPKSVAGYLADHQAFLLRSHGVLTIGRNMEEAYNRMEAVEHYAKIIYIADHSGGAIPLEEEEIQRLREIGRSLKSGQLTDDKENNS